MMITAHDEFEGKIISVKLDGAIITKADLIAKKVKISRLRLFSHVLTVGISEVLENTLFFQLGYLVNEISRAIYSLKTVDKLYVIPMKVNNDNIEKLDLIASKWSTTRHDAMKKILTSGVLELDRFNRLGLIKAALLVKDIEEAFRGVCKKGNAAYESAEEDK